MASADGVGSCNLTLSQPPCTYNASQLQITYGFDSAQPTQKRALSGVEGGVHVFKRVNGVF